MTGIAVIKRYAGALFEAGKDAGVLDEIRSDILYIDGLLKDAPEIRQFCLSPHHNLHKEQVFIRTAFIPYTGVFTGRMLEILCENKRLSALPFIPEAFHERENRDADIETLEIETVNELSEETLHHIEKRMQEKLQKKIESKIRLNPALIGGIRITWANRTIDMSLRGRLNKMKKMLK